MREKSLDLKIQKYCKENNIYCVKIWGGGYQSSGIPDLLMCVNGHFVAFEDKAGSNKTSALQDWNIQKIKDAGGFAYEIRDFETAKKILIDLTNQP